MSGFDGLVHAFSTIATGGMGNCDTSFAGFTPGGAVRRHRLHAARGDVLRPLRAVRPRRAGALFRDSQIRAFLLIYAGLALASSPRGSRSATRSTRPTVREVALQPRLGDHHHRLRLDRLFALGAARRRDVLLRDDDLRLLGLDRRRAEGLPLPAALLGAISGEVRRLHSPERRPHPALPGRGGLRRGPRLGHRLLHAVLPDPRRRGDRARRCSGSTRSARSPAPPPASRTSAPASAR